MFTINIRFVNHAAVCALTLALAWGCKNNNVNAIRIDGGNAAGGADSATAGSKNDGSSGAMPSGGADDDEIPAGGGDAMGEADPCAAAEYDFAVKKDSFVAGCTSPVQNYARYYQIELAESYGTEIAVKLSAGTAALTIETPDHTVLADSQLNRDDDSSVIDLFLPPGKLLLGVHGSVATARIDLSSRRLLSPEVPCLPRAAWVFPGTVVEVLPIGLMCGEATVHEVFLATTVRQDESIAVTGTGADSVFGTLDDFYVYLIEPSSGVPLTDVPPPEEPRPKEFSFTSPVTAVYLLDIGDPSPPSSGMRGAINLTVN